MADGGERVDAGLLLVVVAEEVEEVPAEELAGPGGVHLLGRLVGEHDDPVGAGGDDGQPDGVQQTQLVDVALHRALLPDPRRGSRPSRDGLIVAPGRGGGGGIGPGHPR